VAGSHHSICPPTAAIFPGNRVLRRAAGFQITPSKSFICLVALLCALALLLQINDASAQCAAQDVVGNRRPLGDSSLSQTSDVIQSAAGTPVWKTVKVGTSASKWDLLRNLDTANCGVGDSAEQIFAQPEFVVGSAKIDTDLVSVSLAQLGLQAATLRDIYARAQNLGFALAAAEVGPQLRLQYFEQPLGEFLNIGMTPIATREGRQEIFAVGNGGAGLLLVGKEASEAIAFQSTARFVFVRQRNVASSQASD
jgi:hypothetical protein